MVGDDGHGGELEKTPSPGELGATPRLEELEGAPKLGELDGTPKLGELDKADRRRLEGVPNAGGLEKAGELVAGGEDGGTLTSICTVNMSSSSSSTCILTSSGLVDARTSAWLDGEREVSAPSIAGGLLVDMESVICGVESEKGVLSRVNDVRWELSVSKAAGLSVSLADLSVELERAGAVV